LASFGDSNLTIILAKTRGIEAAELNHSRHGRKLIGTEPILIFVADPPTISHLT
jgi:hypothetical protein